MSLNLPSETFTVKNIITVDYTKCKHSIERVEIRNDEIVLGCHHPENKSILCTYEVCPLKSKNVILKA